MVSQPADPPPPAAQGSATPDAIPLGLLVVLIVVVVVAALTLTGINLSATVMQMEALLYG